MRCQLAFTTTTDGRLLVNLEVSLLFRSGFTAVAFDDENSFIYGVVTAAFSNELTVQIISAVLLTMSDRSPRPRWIAIELDEDQLAVLGLELAVSVMTGPEDPESLPAPV